MPDYQKTSTAFTRDINPYTSNAPPQYENSVNRQYMVERNKAFLARAFLACDCIDAEVQGMNEENFFEFVPKRIRLADAKALSAVSSRKTDDYKEMLVDDPNIDYVPMGAKVVTMGSTFIVVNPYNLSGALPKSLLVRCNTSYNSYDEYGNVVTEPIFITKELMTGNENLPLKKEVLMDGYFNVICQYNEKKAKLNQNKRFILGTKAYYITGFNDFTQEFSGDRSSVRLLTFTCRIEEPTEYDDISVNYIAGGKNFKFGAEIDGGEEARVNLVHLIQPHFIVNGEISALPCTWSATSSDSSVVKVLANVISGILLDIVGEGTATITVRLEENPNIVAQIEITASSQGGVTMEFLGTVPKNLRQNTSEQLQVRLYVNGHEPNGTTYNIVLSGADPSCYYADYAQGSSSITIYCLAPCDTPLTVTSTASSLIGSGTVTKDIYLVGY